MEDAKERQVNAGKEFGRGQEKPVEKIPQAIAQEADPKSREKAAVINQPQNKSLNMEKIPDSEKGEGTAD